MTRGDGVRGSRVETGERPRFATVTVVLGDPGLTDRTKPGRRFTDDDLR